MGTVPMNSPKIYAVMNEEYEIKSNCGSLMGTVPMNSMGTVPMNSDGEFDGDCPQEFLSVIGTVPMIFA